MDGNDVLISVRTTSLSESVDAEQPENWMDGLRRSVKVRRSNCRDSGSSTFLRQRVVYYISILLEILCAFRSANCSKFCSRRLQSFLQPFLSQCLGIIIFADLTRICLLRPVDRLTVTSNTRAVHGHLVTMVRGHC